MPKLTDGGVLKPGALVRAELTLYSRADCHLCHDMEAQLAGLLAEYPFEVTVVDVDKEPAALERYDELVPVLMHGERELARYRVNLPALRA